MCVRVCACVCVFRVGLRVFRILRMCMWGVKVLKCIIFSCSAFPHLMTAVCRLEETQVLMQMQETQFISHCDTFFLTASFFCFSASSVYSRTPLSQRKEEEHSRPSFL